MQCIKAKKAKANLSHDYHWFICSQKDVTFRLSILIIKGNNKITELRTILQRESQNS